MQVRTFLTAMALASVAISAAHGDMLAGQASVIDGDTIEIHGQRIRMAGIDAPEARQVCAGADGKDYRCGQIAAFALADFISKQSVICSGKQHDRYRRLIVTCSVTGIDLSAWMVVNGLAVAYREYSEAYIPQEDEARAAHRGIWEGKFEMPWDWRKVHQ